MISLANNNNIESYDTLITSDAYNINFNIIHNILMGVNVKYGNIASNNGGHVQNINEIVTYKQNIYDDYTFNGFSKCMYIKNDTINELTVEYDTSGYIQSGKDITDTDNIFFAFTNITSDNIYPLPDVGETVTYNTNDPDIGTLLEIVIIHTNDYKLIFKPKYINNYEDEYGLYSSVNNNVSNDKFVIYQKETLYDKDDNTDTIEYNYLYFPLFVYYKADIFELKVSFKDTEILYLNNGVDYTTINEEEQTINKSTFTPNNSVNINYSYETDTGYNIIDPFVTITAPRGFVHNIVYTEDMQLLLNHSWYIEMSDPNENFRIHLNETINKGNVQYTMGYISSDDKVLDYFNLSEYILTLSMRLITNEPASISPVSVNLQYNEYPLSNTIYNLNSSVTTINNTNIKYLAHYTDSFFTSTNSTNNTGVDLDIYGSGQNIFIPVNNYDTTSKYFANIKFNLDSSTSIDILKDSLSIGFYNSRTDIISNLIQFSFNNDFENGAFDPNDDTTDLKHTTENITLNSMFNILGIYQGSDNSNSSFIQLLINWNNTMFTDNGNMNPLFNYTNASNWSDFYVCLILNNNILTGDYLLNIKHNEGEFIKGSTITPDSPVQYITGDSKFRLFPKSSHNDYTSGNLNIQKFNNSNILYRHLINNNYDELYIPVVVSGNVSNGKIDYIDYVKTDYTNTISVIAQTFITQEIKNIGDDGNVEFSEYNRKFASLLMKTFEDSNVIASYMYDEYRKSGDYYISGDNGNIAQQYIFTGNNTQSIKPISFSAIRGAGDISTVSVTFFNNGNIDILYYKSDGTLNS